MPYTFERRSVMVFGLLAVALIVSNVYAVHQSRSARQQYDQLRASTFAVAEGAVVPPLNGVRAGGTSEIEVNYASKHATLLLVFGPKCPYSNRNWPQWQHILERIDRDKVQVAFVNAAVLDPVDMNFSLSHALGDEVVLSAVDSADRVAYRISLTPQTLVIDPTGKIKYVRTGMLDDSTVEEIVRLVS